MIDIKGIINRNGKKLDVEYIRSWLKNFSLLLETDDVINRFEIPFSEWKEWARKKSNLARLSTTSPADNKDSGHPRGQLHPSHP